MFTFRTLLKALINAENCTKHWAVLIQHSEKTLL